MATANWLSVPAEGGAELDLTKAFDLMPHSVAVAALQFFGVPWEIIGTFLSGWRAPRRCMVLGALAAPLCPVRGAGQGDPALPRVFSFVMSPWN
eukprot:12176542-Alexandrium_andersonii.AAC.1